MRFTRRVLVVLALLSVAAPALAQSEDRVVEFVDLSGILDNRMLEFAISSIEDAAARGDTEVVILQIDSPVSSEPPRRCPSWSNWCPLRRSRS
jgi:membrane-bound ClpP family serine protease